MQELETIQKTLEAVKKTNTVTVMKDQATGKTVGLFVTLYDENAHEVKAFHLPIAIINSDNRMKYYVNKAKALPAVLVANITIRGKSRYVTPMEYNSNKYSKMCTTAKEAAKILEPFIVCGYCC